MASQLDFFCVLVVVCVAGGLAFPAGSGLGPPFSQEGLRDLDLDTEPTCVDSAAVFLTLESLELPQASNFRSDVESTLLRCLKDNSNILSLCQNCLLGKQAFPEQLASLASFENNECELQDIAP